MASAQLVHTKPLELLSSITHYDLPPIPCSLPVRCHPEYATLSCIADNWAIDAMQLSDPRSIARAVQSRVPLAYCFLVPEGRGEAEMVASCKYIWTTSFIDDPFDEETDVRRAIGWKQVVLRAATGKANAHDLSVPTIRAFADLMAEVRRMMPRRMLSRFMEAHYAWADHCVDMVRRRQLRDPPSVPKYIADRRENLLMEPEYILGELCMGVDLDDEFLASAEFKGIWNTMLEHVLMVNDIMSIRVDLINHHFYSLPSLLFLTDPDIKEFQQAVDRTCSMIQDKEKEFIRLHEILTDKAKRSKNASTLKYVKALPYYISGNWYWHYLSARYHDVDNPFLTGEPFHGTIFIHPQKSLILPPYRRNKHPFLVDVDNLKRLSMPNSQVACSAYIPWSSPHAE